MGKTTYIAFLRAINVGGRFVKMERLRALFSEMGLENVRTFIQSGNVFFETDESDRAELTQKIERHLFEALGYEVPVMLRTPEEVECALNLEPFRDVDVADDVRLCIAFLSEPLPQSAALPHVSPRGDMELRSATQGELFVVVRQVVGKASNPAAFIEKNYKIKATLRFWSTTARILEAAKAAQ